MSFSYIELEHQDSVIIKNTRFIKLPKRNWSGKRYTIYNDGIDVCNVNNLITIHPKETVTVEFDNSQLRRGYHIIEVW